ncbi:universal stress protein [Fulvivirga sp.]|uniref:universal stress protein n=1 Tax=Fulvivirga sp. TaxID=1931237 RepID=UPI0032EBDDCC
MMKRILIPTDFSATAKNAISLAMAIAKKEKSTIYLLHVIELNIQKFFEMEGEFYNTEIEKKVIDQLLVDANKKLNEQLKELDLSHLKVEKIVEFGEPKYNIIEKINELAIDLVVMGTHGATGIRESLIGSNVEKIIRNSPCPVIAIKHEMHLKDVKNIVFGSDFIEINDKVVQSLKQLQDLLQAHLILVRINTPNNFARDLEINVLKKKILKRYMFVNASTQSYNDLTIEAGLRHFAEDNDAQIIALATHGRKWLTHLAAGSIAEDMANHTTKAVWTYHF